MNASEVVAKLATEGVELAFRDGRLCVRPSLRTRPALLALVRENAPALRQLLGRDIEDDDRYRQAFEERAAIMEYDGGLSREDAERQAAAGFRQQYAHAREAREPPTSDAGRADEVLTPSARVRAREAAIKKQKITIPPPRVSLEWGDLRPCTLCRNLLRSGRCRAAWVGLLRAARDYEPSHPKQPRRCIGYDPKADDPEQTPGMERWPELAEWQARIVDPKRP